MKNNFGGQSMVAPLRRVLVRRPDEEFAVDDPERWHYIGQPNLQIAQEEHDELARLLRSHGIEVIEHDVPQPGRADAVYVFDPVLITNSGTVVLSPGKALRRGEESALEGRLKELGVPVAGRIVGEGTVEAGDLMWLDRHTLLAGRGFRTNQPGIEQLADILLPMKVDVIPFDLPVYLGSEACLHLLSLLSLIDEDLALVYRPLLPVGAWQLLMERAVEVIEVPEQEFSSMGPNVLALAPRVCLQLDGNNATRVLLERAGCQVQAYRGEEISQKGEGGPTCLTLPILRKQ